MQHNEKFNNNQTCYPLGQVSCLIQVDSNNFHPKKRTETSKLMYQKEKYNAGFNLFYCLFSFVELTRRSLPDWWDQASICRIKERGEERIGIGKDA